MGKNGGLTNDVIRCDEVEYLIWKWHPVNTEAGANKRENAIRWNSSLRVREGSVAVFVYKAKDGTFQDYIEGPYDETLKAKNFPVWTSIKSLFSNGDSLIQAEVYFINLAHVIQVRFGVPYFNVFDPRYPDFSVPVAVRGTITFGIDDYHEFIKLHRLDSFNLETFSDQIRDAVVRYVKQHLVDYAVERNESVLQIEKNIFALNQRIEDSIQDRLIRDFGVKVSGVDISAIDIDHDSDGYKRLRAMTQDFTEKDVLEDREAALAKKRIKNRQEMEDLSAIHSAEREDIIERMKLEREKWDWNTNIDLTNKSETLKINREEGGYRQHMGTQSENFGVYKMDKATELGIAGTDALAMMNMNSGGTVGTMGNDSNNNNGLGFNPAQLIATVGVTSAVTKNINKALNEAMDNGQTQYAGQMNYGGMPNGMMPPPIPQIVYYLAINGNSMGPYAFEMIRSMLMAGQINMANLIWKQGMAQWAQISTLPEFAGAVPPVPPAPPAIG